MIQGLEHVGLASPNPEKLAQWYVDTLGFVINYQSATSRTRFVKAPNGSMLEIIESKGEMGGAPSQKDPGIRHLALTCTDFEAVYESLKAEGVVMVGEPSDSKGNKVVFFRDPDGNLLHLIQREKPL